MGSKWTAADIPDQSGRTAIVTGANSGLGYDTAAALADKGAQVVLAVRNLDKGTEAKDRIKTASPNAIVTLQELDLSSLDSVRRAADELRAAHPRIDLLINNAGVMYVPNRELTKDGFEMQFGTNHLGHFALTGLLLDHLLPVDGSRIVTVSSVGHRLMARIRFEDPHFETGYNRVQAYGQSKLANLLFTYELQRRLKLKGAPTIAAAAHPGFSDTELMRYIPGFVPDFIWKIVAQPASMGALPTLRAATDPGVAGGQYYGPDGIGEVKGHPKVVASSGQSHNEDIQRRLWTMSEELTGVTYPV
ncbi:SDR family NAD(P)-dependent oxidoreductase [Mycolicibacterium celeriflavum]|uniref:Short-chain dehydrogenase n=1 Tax=Mycolicibacterium celeriflavum TaxID=1249101 RepID=A0A1X0BSZ3_MYCCF|nr:SDR family NAD(P)-dependent oxidoreductase [Mycolicibacterium celeriflavum]MCV7239185.1 SDR family NAD(P)-dependent oxidoreductase [Mycolicibacterium celeriflavum]ORA46904.1 short-chain dehydrogenase [Mycolicibacterium celeriflavum]BBY44487.1 short-chain dehydrogenase [Mycolicibacterium celeriflavum]